MAAPCSGDRDHHPYVVTPCRVDPSVLAGLRNPTGKIEQEGPQPGRRVRDDDVIGRLLRVEVRIVDHGFDDGLGTAAMPFDASEEAGQGVVEIPLGSPMAAVDL